MWFVFNVEKQLNTAGQLFIIPSQVDGNDDLSNDDYHYDTDLGEASEVDEDLLHLLGKHFLEVFVTSHELDEHLVPRLDAVHVRRVEEDTSLSLYLDVPNILLDAASRGWKIII